MGRHVSLSSDLFSSLTRFRYESALLVSPDITEPIGVLLASSPTFSAVEHAAQSVAQAAPISASVEFFIVFCVCVLLAA